MDIPIKMIDIATGISWIFLIIFSVSAVYSVKDLAFDFGRPQLGTTSDGKMLFSLPIEIANKGYYNIGLFNVTTKVLAENGSVIAEGSTLIPTIGKDEILVVLHNMTFDVAHLLEFNQNYLFNDTQLNTVESVSMRLGGFILVQASGNFSIPWSAPLYNFKLGEPQYTVLNFTHMQVTVPISFDNHATVDITGEAQIRMYNGTNELVGFGRIDIEAPQHSHYDGNVGLYAVTSSVTRTGRFELRLQMSLFNYGPMVIPYG
jgi:hypothetical protein